MTDSQAGRIHLVGSLRTVGGQGEVRLEDRFDTDIADLWAAVTARARLARWLGEFEGELRLGGVFEARFFASEWAGTGRVQACDPPRHLAVQMTQAGASQPQTIEVRLRADGESTVLVVEQRGMPGEHAPAYGAGVQIHVEDLAASLAGQGRCDARARWTELLPSWQAKVVGPA